MLTKINNDEVAIKVRGCTYEINQRNWISKEETSLPTVSTDGLIISCVIDTMEVQDLATADIPEAILKTDYDKGDIHIKMEGAMVTLLEEICPSYYKDFIYIYSHKICIYEEFKKAVYVTLEASLLFWTKLSKSLEEMGYQRNEYDWCVMKKIVKGKQCTILWHV